MRTAPLFLVAAVVAATANLGTSQAFGAPQALISEFLAANSNGLRDEDGDASDWIEIHNPTAATINLEGWHLTDNDDNLDKWTFPSVEIAPGGFLMVFASKKDRARVGSELHTDFQLSSGGEYLGLVQPDLGIASEFASEYPTQFANTSYGLVPNKGAMVSPDANADASEGFLPGLARYFTQPTPGAQNGMAVADVGPIVSRVSEPEGALAATPPFFTRSSSMGVTATVRPTSESIDEVLLHYRVMFDAEFKVPMLDDGAHGDRLAGDGVFGATIPAGVAKAGQMLRYRITASDSQDNTSSWPPFADPLGTPEYLGTMVDVSITTSLPVLHWFTANVSAAGTVGGSRASLFFEGEFYDNVWVHGRGAGGTGAGLKFEMNRGFDFRHSADAPRVRQFNTRSSTGEIAELIAYELYHDAQTPTPQAFPMRFHRNGSFVSVDTFFDQVDETLLKRNGLDGNGALYKMFNSLTDPVDRSYRFYRNDNNKRTRKWDLVPGGLFDLFKHVPAWDLDELVAGVDEDNPDRYPYVMDNVDVPAVINYLAATVISCDYDHETHNYFMYRDNDGTGRWQVIPWDRNIAFITPASDPTSHPFLGSSEYVHRSWANLEGKSDEQWSRLTDAIYDNPVTREMYLRRLRTLMDELLQPPGTPLAERKLETRLDELSALLQSEDRSLASSARAIKNVVDARRRHLYVTHSVDNLAEYPGAAGIPHAQSGNPQIEFGPIDFNPISGNQDEEYIRLDNPNGVAVDLSNWSLAGGVEHAFRPGTVIPASGSLYVSPNVLSFLARTTEPSGGQELFVQGNYEGHISNAGETIQLVAPDAEIVATVLTPVGPSDADVVTFPINPLGDDDGNGIADLIDYATGSSRGLPPLVPTASFETYDIGGSLQTRLALSYPINLGAEGASIGIEASTDLRTWTDTAPNKEFVSQTNLGDGRALVTVRFTSPIGDGVRHYLRLRVEQL